MGKDPLEDRLDREYQRLGEQPGRTALRWMGILLAVILVASIGFGVVSWITSWGGEAKRITGPGNVREQNTEVIRAWEDMEVAAQNVCDVRAAGASEGDPTLLEDPTVAYKATYRRIRAEYNRRMANIYEAQTVRRIPVPSNLRSYPQVAPTLQQKLDELCPSG